MTSTTKQMRAKRKAGLQDGGMSPIHDRCSRCFKLRQQNITTNIWSCVSVCLFVSD